MPARAVALALVAAALLTGCIPARDDECDRQHRSVDDGCRYPQDPSLGIAAGLGGGRFVDLGSVDDLFTTAIGVNDRAEVLLRAVPGGIADGSERVRLVRVQGGGRRVELVPPPGWAIRTAELDDRGAVAGTVERPDHSATRAVRWPAPAAPAPGTLPPSRPAGAPPPRVTGQVRPVALAPAPSEVVDVAPSGAVLVVRGPTGGVRRGLVWTGRGPVDLGEVVTLSAISDDGTVVGSVPQPGPRTVGRPGPGTRVGQQRPPPPGLPGRPAVHRAGRWAVWPDPGGTGDLLLAADDTGLVLGTVSGSPTDTVGVWRDGRPVWAGPRGDRTLLRAGRAVVGDRVVTPDGRTAVLGDLGGGRVAPAALDRCGRVVGSGPAHQAVERAVLWTGGRPRVLAGRGQESEAWAVADRGLVAGGFQPVLGPAHAALWPVPPCRGGRVR